jgi:hypothetical protein
MIQPARRIVQMEVAPFQPSVAEVGRRRSIWPTAEHATAESRSA